MTVGEWLDKWSTDYLGSVKPATVCAYKATINTHLKPGLGAVRLDALEPHIIQSFYNGLLSPKKKEKAVSPKTVKNTHGVLHKALQQAVSNGYIRINPTDACVLPRVEKKQIQPLDEDHFCNTSTTNGGIDTVRGLLFFVGASRHSPLPPRIVCNCLFMVIVLFSKFTQSQVRPRASDSRIPVNSATRNKYSN